MKKGIIFLTVFLFLLVPLYANADLLGTGTLNLVASTPNAGGYRGDYDGKVVSSDFGYTTDWEEVFCVSPEHMGSVESVTFYSIDGSRRLELQQAAYIADNWEIYGSTDDDKVEAQKAIWALLGIVNLNTVVGASGNDRAFYDAAKALTGYSTTNWYWADSLNKQDYLTPVSPVPEPTPMILLGSSLIGLAGFGRRKFFKK